MCDDRSSFFVAHQPPNRPVGSQTLSRWTKELLGLAGVDVSTFKSHATQAAASLLHSKSLNCVQICTRNICEDEVYPFILYVPMVPNILYCIWSCIIIWVTALCFKGAVLGDSSLQFMVLSILTFQLSTLVPISWTLGLKTTVNMEIIQTTSDRIIFIYWVLKHKLQLCCCTLKSLLSQMSNLQ